MLLSCSLCQKSFSKTFNLNRHLQQIHSMPGAVRKRIYNANPNDNSNNNDKHTSRNMSDCGNTFSDKVSSSICSDGINANCASSSGNITKPVPRSQKHHVCCDNVYSPEEYKIHLKTHVYKCPICHFQSLHKSSLNQHYRSHLATSRVFCKDCDKTFKSMKSYNFHLKSIHLGQSKVYECGCGYKTIHKSTFRRHSGKCTGVVVTGAFRSNSSNSEISDGNDSQVILHTQSQISIAVESQVTESLTELVMSDEQTLVSQDESDLCHSKALQSLNQSPAAQYFSPQQVSQQSSQLLEQTSEKPSLVEWITGFNHPRTLKSEKRKFSCHAPNCAITFTRFYDFKRHFQAVHHK